MEEENGIIIKKAFYALKERINTSVLSENEKNALRVLIDKLIIYYDRRIDLMKKRGISSERVASLDSFMTDIIVDINTVIKGESDVHYFVSLIIKKLNDKELENMIKNNRK